jgi:hypothetical protein
VIEGRDREERYRLYALVDGEPHELASCPDARSIGPCLVTLMEDDRAAGLRFSERGPIGILDGWRREWVVSPWRRKEP